MVNRIFTLTHEFTFHAAHQLPWHPGKCARLHGHTYRLEVHISGPLNDHGIVVDFDDVAQQVTSILDDHYDHRNLNDTFSNPTAELIAVSLADRITQSGLAIDTLRLWETPNASVIVDLQP